MASYKIYFLNFCYKNRSSSATNKPAKLQNASLRAVFLKIVIFAPVGDVSSAADRRGLIVKTQQAFSPSMTAEEQVDQVGHVADVDSAIAIHVTNLGRRDFNPA